jgi:ketosteroid isomerase-like protein
MGVFIAALSGALALMCTSAMAQDEMDIQKLENSLADAAFNKSDANAVSNFYAADAVLMPPNRGAIRGQSEIAAFWQKEIEEYADMKPVTEAITRLGSDAVLEIGNVSFKTKSQPDSEIDSKYVVLWRKTGTEWKISTDIWNSNKAP